jgi:NTP pyrophosphatase (non-canonical NTP hydrolase)
VAVCRAGQGHVVRGGHTRLLIVLTTSPRVAPGLLSWQAWEALRSASLVLAPPGHPQLPALEEAGIGVTVAEPPAGDAGPETAAAVAGWLVAAASPVAGDVVWLAPPEGGISPPGQPIHPGLPGADLAGELSGLLGTDQVRLMAGSADLAGARLIDLVQAMDRLRTECPWDARQTHESLAPHLLEEPYEALEALESGDPQAFCEELGDVLLQVVFHARVAAERSDGTAFTTDDVADGIVAKLVRRHPHVFGGITVSGADEVQGNWDAIKREEKRAKAERLGTSIGDQADPSVLDGVPFGQPALALAAQLQRRAERAGAPAELAWLGAGVAPAGGRTDRAGTDRAGTDRAGTDGAATDDGGADSADGGEIGRELFGLVARAQAAGIDPELALRAAARRFREVVRDWESAES